MSAAPRRVRVTIEGYAWPRRSAPGRAYWLSLTDVDGRKNFGCVLVDDNVIVDYLPGPREWRDGDVVQCADGRAIARISGSWQLGHKLFCGDTWLTERVESGDGSYTVLRYQAGEDQ